MSGRIFFFILAWLAVTSATAQPAGRPVVVFAAASLQPVLKEIAAEWQRGTGVAAVLSFAASSMLARQIDQGAPADVFMTADAEWMDWADQKKLIVAETRRALLGNTLVLVEPSHEPPSGMLLGSGCSLATAIGGSRLATGDPRTVPLGNYARQSLAASGCWEAVAPRLAAVDNARLALAFVARGEARFGIVYRTDALSEPGVRIIETFPAPSHEPIRYVVALTAASTHPLGRDFLGFLTSVGARRIFEAAGFEVLP